MNRKIIIMLALLSVSIVPSVEANIVHYWSFDNSATYVSNSTHTMDEIGGTLANITEAVFNSAADCNRDGAYYFDGVDDYIKIGNWSIVEEGNGSVSWWMYLNETAAQRGSTISLFSGRLGGGVTIKQTTTGYIEITGTERFTVGGNITNKTWHHLVLTWIDSSDNAVLYVDGIEYTVSVCSGGNTILGVADGTIGYDSSSMFGLIDDVRLYNHVLTDDEVDTLYLHCHPELVPELRGSGGGSSGNLSTARGDVLMAINETMLINQTSLSEQKETTPFPWWIILILIWWYYNREKKKKR